MADIHSNLLNSFSSDPRANSVMQHDAEIILLLTKQLRKVEKQRDELLVALKEIHKIASDEKMSFEVGNDLMEEVSRTAISKAEPK